MVLIGRPPFVLSRRCQLSREEYLLVYTYSWLHMQFLMSRLPVDDYPPEAWQSNTTFHFPICRRIMEILADKWQSTSWLPWISQKTEDTFHHCFTRYQTYQIIAVTTHYATNSTKIDQRWQSLMLIGPSGRLPMIKILRWSYICSFHNCRYTFAVHTYAAATLAVDHICSSTYMQFPQMLLTTFAVEVPHLQVHICTSYIRSLPHLQPHKCC